jgi:hypothetical protein
VGRVLYVGDVMPAPMDSRLEKAIRASEAAGKAVRSARIEGNAIELTFGEGDPVAPIGKPADLINWNRK